MELNILRVFVIFFLEIVLSIDHKIRYILYVQTNTGLFNV